MDFKILDVTAQNGHLVVTAQHYKPDGSPWFTENYLFQGREGLKQKRATNVLGQILQDDDTVAPTVVVRRGPPDQVEQVLEPGKRWKLLPGPHMDESSILGTIRLIHAQRVASGFQGNNDRLVTPPSTVEDGTGCNVLLARFSLMKGREG